MQLKEFIGWAEIKLSLCLPTKVIYVPSLNSRSTDMQCLLMKLFLRELLFPGIIPSHIIYLQNYILFTIYCLQLFSSFCRKVFINIIF